MLDYGRTFMGDLMLTPTALSQWVDVSYYDDDDLADDTVIETAMLAQVGATILSVTKPYTISNNITLPEHITFVCVNKGELIIDTGITFTVEGISITGGRIIHSGPGLMKYGLVQLFSELLPTNVIYAKCGSVCFHTSETSGRLYVKQSGNNTATGWTVK
jgi:hypothetical protein